MKRKTEEQLEGQQRRKDFYSQRFPYDNNRGSFDDDGEEETVLQEKEDPEEYNIVKDSMARIHGMMQDNFITRPPRDLWQGFVNAVSNMSKGYWNGCYMVWDHAFQGFDIGGAFGLAGGAMTGLVAGAAVVAGGVVASVSQLIQGIYNTPMAFHAPSEGKTWDEDEGKWKYYSLDEEVREFEREQAESEGSNRHQNLRQRSNRKVKETHFYRMLKVPTDATSSEIKRAYYREAIKVHPDKNRGDTSAETKFQQLSAAYQVLSREETRETYDTFGKCYLQHHEQDSPLLDAHVFFDVMFGSRLVEPYVGELQIASLVDDFLSLTDVESIKKQSTYEDNGTRQKRRVLDIALHLRKSIAKVVEGTLSEEGFRLSCRAEAVGIANGDLGDDFLISIGRALVTPARNYIANRKSILQGTARSVQTSTNDIMQKYHTASAFLQSVTSVFGPLMNAFAQHGSTTTTTTTSPDKEEPEFMEYQNADSCGEDAAQFQVDTMELMKKLEKSIPKAFRLIRQLNDRDIRRTLKVACSKVIGDGGDTEVSLKRAKALLVLGEVFYEMGLKFHREDRWKDEDYLRKLMKRAYSAATVDVVIEEYYAE